VADQSLSFGLFRHVVFLDDFADLRLEAHVEHAVSLVEAQVRDLPHRHPLPPQQVRQPAWRRNYYVTPAVELVDLLVDRFAAVHAHRLDRRPVGELGALCVDLQRQLARRRQDQALGLRFLAAAVVGPPEGSCARVERLFEVHQHALEDREQKPAGLA
jgi:hypothetical protein